MRITVNVNGLPKLTSRLTDLQKRQIPFAESRAINALAYMVQRDTISRLLPEKFILRTDWWRPGRKTGVNFFPSKKSQWPNLVAIVNTLAPFMELQETGGTKTPKPGQSFVPVPTYSAQPDKRQLIRPERRFRALVSGKKASKRTLTHNGDWWITTLMNSRPTLAVRLLNRYRLPIAAMYLGLTSVTIKPRFGFRANANRIVVENYPAVFTKEIQFAIATAK